jgi:hypothetical protein
LKVSNLLYQKFWLGFKIRFGFFHNVKSVSKTFVTESPSCIMSMPMSHNNRWSAC